MPGEGYPRTKFNPYPQYTKLLGTDRMVRLKLKPITTAQRDALTPANGMVIWNSTTSQYEGYNGAWVPLDLTAHVAAADPHTGYRLESADHTHQSAGAQAGQLDHGLALTGLTDDDHTQYVLKSLFDAQTLLAAVSDNTPVALTVAEQRLVGRITAGNIAALTAAQVKTLLAIDHGADLAGLSDDDHTQYILRSLLTTQGDIIKRGATVAERLAKGTAEQALQQGASEPAWGWNKTLRDADGDTKIQVEESADEDKIRMDVAGVEAFLLHDSGILDLAKQSRVRTYKNADQNLIASTDGAVLYEVEHFDEQNEFDISVKTGAADATEALKLHDADGGFATSDVGAWVWNTTDNTYTTVTAFVDSGELDLAADIMVSGEGYKLYHSRFVATESGYYTITANACVKNLAADVKVLVKILKNGAWVAHGRIWPRNANAAGAIFGAAVLYLAANDYVQAVCWHNDSVTRAIAGNAEAYNNISVHKVS